MQKGLTEAVTPFLREKGWEGKPNSFVTWWRRTHFENSMIDALCDRGHTPYRADRPSRGLLRHGSLRHRLHARTRCAGWSARSRSSSRFPTWSRRSKSCAAPATSSRSSRTATATCSRPPARTSAFPSTTSSRSQQAGYFKPHWKTYAKAEEIIGEDRSSHPVRRQPCLRLHRRQVLRHAHRVHRPAQAAVRRDAASARSDRGRFRRIGRRHGVRLGDTGLLLRWSLAMVPP